MTERTQCTFSVSEYEGQETWILVETYDSGLKILNNGHIGFDLREDVTFKEAVEIAELLRDKIKSISYTKVS